MEYQAVGNRIGVDFISLDLPIPKDEALDILEKSNIRRIEVNIHDIAKELVGKAQWKLLSRQWEAPYFFDCSSLTKWLYGQKGIWIPRRSRVQFHFCGQSMEIDKETRLVDVWDTETGDLLFTDSVSTGRKKSNTDIVREVIPGDLIFLSSPYKNGVKTDSDDGIGHVCIASGSEKAICATKSEFGKGIIELPIRTFLDSRKLRGIGRIIPEGREVITLIFPPKEEIETIDDIRSIVLRSR